METARANPLRIPMTGRERAGVSESLEHWRAEAKASPENDFARSMVQRLNAAHEAGKVFEDLKQLASFGNPKTSMTAVTANERIALGISHPQRSAADLLQDLRVLNKQVAEVTASLPQASRATFIKRAGIYLETIASKVDQRRAEEARIESDHKSDELQPLAHRTHTAEQVSGLEFPRAQNGQATGRQVGADTFKSILSDPRPNAPLEETRRQQAEMLERLAKERQQVKAQEKGYEAGDER